MELLKTIYLEFVNTFYDMKGKFWKFSLSSLLDTVYMFIVFILGSFFFSAFETHIDAMSRVLSENEGIITGVDVPVSAVADFKFYLEKAITVLLIYLAIIIIINLAFKMFQWFICSSFVKKNFKLGIFLKRFAASYLVYALVASFFIMLSIFISYATFFSMEGLVEGMTIIMGLLVLYFSLITFSLLHNNKPSLAFKKTFGSIGIKKVHLVLLGYLVPFIMLVLFYYLISAVIFSDIWVTIVFALLLGFIFTFSRSFLIRYFKEIEKN